MIHCQVNDFKFRDLEESDIPHYVNYYHGSSPQYFEALGMDQSKFPSREMMIEDLTKYVAARDREDKSQVFIVEKEDSGPIAVIIVKAIVRGSSADVHCHIFAEKHRNQGIGKLLFAPVLKTVVTLFQLQKVVFDPSETNPAPLGLLGAMGLPATGKIEVSRETLAQLSRAPD